jgi:proteasome accessory factor A
LRDEPHATGNQARMHIIFFDRVLCPIANYLMAGATQLVLAMAEAGWADPSLLLDDPLEAAHEVSRDLILQKALPMAQRGRHFSAVEIQRALADLAGEFIASEDAGQAVPGAAAIVACWQETLDLLARRDLAALMRRCDWALKYVLLERQRGRKGLTWQSPELMYLDLLYASLDPEEGLFWQMAAADQIEAMPAPEQVERFVQEPPDETRAYLRAHLLRRFGDAVGDMDWAWMRFRSGSDCDWRSEQIIGLSDPTRFGRAESEPLLAQHTELSELVKAIRALTPDEDSMDYPYGGRRRRDSWTGYASQTPLLPGFYAY